MWKNVSGKKHIEGFLRAGTGVYSLKSHKLIFSLLWKKLSETVKWSNIFYVIVYNVPYAECRMN